MLTLTAPTYGSMIKAYGQAHDVERLCPHVQNWLHQNENLFGHKTNLFGHKTLFDRDGLEKNLRAFGPQIFFSRNFWGCICVAVCWPKSAPPCAGRNLRRRVLAENLAKICAAVLRCHF